MTKAVSVIILLFSFFILIKCATRGHPSGGPEDKTPPEIISTFPTIDSLGVEDLDEIIITFSERMDESSVKKALFISPPLEYELDWSGGDELTLQLSSDTLQKDQTYVITIGADAKDSRRNRLKESFQFAFSSGDKLDRGQISGTVYGVDQKEVLYVFAYSISPKDTIDPRYKKARFLTQTGKDGIFHLNYLPLGEYRIYVVQDQNKNLIFDAAYEKVGIPLRDVLIDSILLSHQGLNFKLTTIDTTSPFITGARAINDKTILLRISEEIKRPDLDFLSVVDTLNGDTLEIKGLTKTEKSGSQYYIFTSKQDSAAPFQIAVDGLIDTSGNKQFEPSIVYFTASSTTDTTRFEILNINPKDSLKNFSIFSNIKIHFSLPINTNSISNSFNFVENEIDTVAGSWKWNEYKNGSFSLLDKKLQPGTDYHYYIQTGLVKSIWGDTLSDSLITRMFSTLSPDEFGSLSGKININPKINKNVYLIARSLGSKNINYTAAIAENNQFNFEWLPEGKYLLNGFLDLDNNGKWSPGKILPFQYCEPFYFQNDTIRIRKRWEVSNKIFEIPGW